MLVDEGVDTGAMLSKRIVPIRDTDTTGTLSKRLAQMGADLLLETIPRWIAGEITAEPQDESRATKAPRLKKEDGQIDWSKSAAQIARTVRAFTPWPGATTKLGDTLLRVLQAEAGPELQIGKPGTVFEAEGWVGVQTGNGILILHELQREGKRPLTAKVFARGERRFLGGRLG